MAEADRLPTLGRPSFDCPTCEALTAQDWYMIFARKMDKDKPPFMPAADAFKNNDLSDTSEDKRAKIRDDLFKWRDRLRTGRPFFTTIEHGYSNLLTGNLQIILLC